LRGGDVGVRSLNEGNPDDTPDGNRDPKSIVLRGGDIGNPPPKLVVQRDKFGASKYSSDVNVVDAADATTGGAACTCRRLDEDARWLRREEVTAVVEDVRAP
jgi:hypothetical protein